MSIPRPLVIAAAGLLALAGAFIAAPVASADSVWFQSVARASASAACPDDAFGTPWQSNWDPAQRSWRPSWAQWANGGAGGFTCDRQITWAKNSPYPSAGCVAYTAGAFVDFRGGWSIDLADTYADADCSTVALLTGAYQLVFVPDGWSAEALCVEAFGEPVTLGLQAPYVWGCSVPS